MDAEHPLVAELRRKYDLRFLREGALHFRAGQFELIELVLAAEKSLLAISATSSGKTVVFLVDACQCFAAGMSAVFLTLRKDLVDQAAKYAAQFTTLDPSEVLTLTGEDPRREREELLSRKYRLLIMTREAFYNDALRELIDWAKIGLVGLDEIHQCQGDDVYMKLIPALKGRNVKLRFFTASPATNVPKLNYLLDVLKPDEKYIVPETGPRVSERICLVGFDPQLEKFRRVFLRNTWKIFDEIEAELGKGGERQKFLFSDFEPDDRVREASPTFSERNALGRRIDALSDSPEKRMLISRAAELGLLTWFQEELLCIGRQAFLEDYGHRFAAHSFTPRRLISALTNASKQISDGRDRWFEARAVRNPEIRAIFGELSAGTPYEILIREDVKLWDDAFRALRGMSPPSGMPYQKVALDFLDEAASHMARNILDHPKVSVLLDIFHRHARSVYSGRMLVFDRTRRHAKFLSLQLEDLLKKHGFSVGFVAGARNLAQRKHRDATLERFHDGGMNVIVATSSLRVGTNVAHAHIGAEYSLASSNPIERVQTRGRFVREAEPEEKVDALPRGVFYYLLTAGTREVLSYHISRRREQQMSRAIRHKIPPVELRRTGS